MSLISDAEAVESMPRGACEYLALVLMAFQELISSDQE
jgi:hypothetical protein